MCSNTDNSCCKCLKVLNATDMSFCGGTAMSSCMNKALDLILEHGLDEDDNIKPEEVK